MEKEMPKFYVEGLDLAKAVVRWTDRAIKRVRWSDKELDKLFAKRSAIEIIASGKTFYMNPCLDLSLVTSVVLKLNNVDYNLVIEEHKKTANFPFNRLHFVIEFNDQTGDYFINYAKLDIVEIAKGPYSSHPNLEQARILRIPGEQIDPDKPIHKILGLDSLDDLGKFFEGYQLTPQLERIKRDNNPETYQNYKAVCGNDLKINIE